MSKDLYLSYLNSLPAVVSQSLSEEEVVLACRGMVKISKLPELEIVTPKVLFDKVKDLTPFDEPDDLLFSLSVVVS